MEKEVFRSFPVNTSNILNLRPPRPLKTSTRKVMSRAGESAFGDWEEEEKGGSVTGSSFRRCQDMTRPEIVDLMQSMRPKF